ncbi:serine/threonine protein phosphatase 2a regulatory subunit a, putative, partial [Perkinsus marinus ATCC 50983]
MPNLISHVDGHYEALVPPLECLARQDETVIRNAAVAGLVKIAEKSESICQQYCFPALVRLAAGEWFTARVSVCSLAPGLYCHCSDPQKAEIRRLFAVLVNDDTPMVRRAAAQQTRYLFQVVDKAAIIAELLGIHRAQATDDVQDSIR